MAAPHPEADSEPYRLHVPRFFGLDRCPVSEDLHAQIRWYIEATLGNCETELCDLRPERCLVYNVLSSDQRLVLALARSVSRLLLHEHICVELPNGHVCVFPVDLSDLYLVQPA